jgi:uncharacterized YccA/Bax inhibitor family protein
MLNKLAMVLLLIGATGSLYFVLHAGRNNKSAVLVSLFVIWGLSPFLGLMLANIVSRSWSFSTRMMLYGLTVLVTFGSLVCYAGVFCLAAAKPAAKFLIVPLISWLLIAIIIPVSISRSKAKIHS